MAVRKRWILGLFSGFFFGLFLGLTLLGLGVVKLDSPALTILPIAGLIIGVGGALSSPLPPTGRARSTPSTPPGDSTTATPA